MKNFVQPGNTVTLPLPEGTKSGDPVLAGALFGVACYDAPVGGGDGEVQLVGVFDLPAVGPIDRDAPVYWDASAKKITAADSGTTGPVGAALLAVGGGGTSCRTRLNGVAVV